MKECNHAYYVIEQLLAVIFGEDIVFPKITDSRIEIVAEKLSQTCMVCGAHISKDYKNSYGMCCGCYAYLVCADGVPANPPDANNVREKIFEAFDFGGENL